MDENTCTSGKIRSCTSDLELLHNMENMLNKLISVQHFCTARRKRRYTWIFQQDTRRRMANDMCGRAIQQFMAWMTLARFGTLLLTNI